MTDNKIVDFVEVVQNEDGQWRVRAKSSNGEIIDTSENYGDYKWARDVALERDVPIKVVYFDEEGNNG